MSRIRSVHPGLFTDESYMALSHAAARVLPGLWCECDDQGVFEWKVLTLKARLLPAHADDMGTILDELVRNRFVTRYELGGKSYGAVRNFTRYQRPKKPNSIHLLPAEFRNYVGLSDASSEHDPPSSDESSEPVPHQSSTGSPKPPQREDGGGRMEDGKKDLSPASQAHPSPPDEARQIVACWNAMADLNGLPQVAKLTGTRAKHIAARIADAGGVDGVLAGITRVAASSFLTGRIPGAKGHESWRADFDFFVSESGFTKVMEGKYDDRENAHSASTRKPGGAADLADFINDLEARVGG